VSENIANFVINWRFEIGIFGVILFSYFAGYFVKWVLDWITGKYEFPPELEHKGGWDKLISNVDELTKGGAVAGQILGWLERLFYVAAIWHAAVFLIPGWMAVKVATKWQTWSGLMNSLKIKSKEIGRKHQATRYIRWRLSQRFLIGNLLNIILAGLICFAATKFIG